MRTKQSSPSWRALWAGILLFTCGVGPINAQQAYRQLNVADEFKDRRGLAEIKKRKNRALRDGGSTDVLDNYYKRFFFPAMTRNENHGRLAAMRVELQKDFQQCRAPQTHAYIRDLAGRFCGGMAKSQDFHPAVRYNAVLILGLLNETEADLRRGQPAQPWGKALSMLARGLKDPDESVRTAALLGLRRHAELQAQPNAPAPFSDNVRKAITEQFLLPLLGNTELTPGHDPEVRDWMRQVAAETLGYVRPAPEPAVLKVLIDVMKDKEAEKTLRCQCVETLGRLPLANAEVPAEKLVEVVAVVAADCCGYELQELTELASQRFGGRRRQQIGPGGPFGMNRMEEEELVVKDELTMPSRRRLVERLVLIHRGLEGDPKLAIGGIAAMSDGETAISMLNSRVTKMIHAAQRVDDDLATYGARLDQQYKTLQSLLPAGEELQEVEPIEEAAEASVPGEAAVAADQ